MKHSIFIFFLAVLMLSCKKTRTIESKELTCNIDSIVVNNKANYTLNNPDCYKFNYKSGNITEISVFYRSRLIEIQKIISDKKNIPLWKEYYKPGILYPTSKRVFVYNTSGFLSAVKLYYVNSTSPNIFIKIVELQLLFTTSEITAINFRWFNPNDSIIPVLTDTITLTGNNGNIEQSQLSNNGGTLYYKHESTDNKLLRDYRFLIDPVFERCNFFDERRHFLPLLINRNTTHSILDGIRMPFFELRVAYNQFDQPESFSSSMATWDYFYKDCR